MYLLSIRTDGINSLCKLNDCIHYYSFLFNLLYWYNRRTQFHHHPNVAKMQHHLLHLVFTYFPNYNLQVVLALKSIGIEEFEMTLPDDPDTGGQNSGIGFLKFAAPDTAEGAFQQLQQPDVLIDIGRTVKEYAQTPTESSQELAMKVNLLLPV